jgi:hypothetical protein
MEEITEPITEPAEVIEESYFEPHSDSDYISAAFNSLASVSDMDGEIMSKTARADIKRIRRQSLRIISHCLNNLYEELFEDSTDSDD